MRGGPGPPLPPGVLEVADQLLLLRVDRDDRLTLGQRGAYALVEMLELGVTIRMGIALVGAGANPRGFTGARCYPGLKHSPKHILRAQELANWLVGQTGLVGAVTKSKDVSSADFANRTGIIFIRDGWGPTDHIDAWNGAQMKGGDPGWISLGKEVWFWSLS